MDKTDKKPIIALLFRILALVFGVSGIVYHMMLNSMLTTGFMVKHNLAYFTLQTNIFSTIIFLMLIIKTIYEYKRTKVLKIVHLNAGNHLACTFYITITMLVYWAILTPLTGFPKNSVLLIDSMLLHTITPLLAIFDFVLFFDHGKVKNKEVFKWLIYPLLYWLSTIVISKFITEPYYTYQMGGETIELMYPYPFLDPSVVGVGGLIGIVIALCLVFIIFGLLYIQIDKKLSK